MTLLLIKITTKKVSVFLWRAFKLDLSAKLSYIDLINKNFSINFKPIVFVEFIVL
jgi:hypothetical protein